MQESDKELLELAAKAINLEYYATNEDDSKATWCHKGYWNPLKDDGDALRLACKLGIDIFPWQNKVYDQKTLGIETATRRDIVVKAAEIGRNV